MVGRMSWKALRWSLALPTGELVESVREGIGGSFFGGHSQAPFAECTGGVSGIFEETRESGHLGVERKAVLVSVATTMHMPRVLTCHENCS
jgi:hypothetical protein